MTETASMRVVPSGKVYRQMFDAQVKTGGKDQHDSEGCLLYLFVSKFSAWLYIQ